MAMGVQIENIRDHIEPNLDEQAPGSIGWHRWTGDRPARFRRALLSHYQRNRLPHRREPGPATGTITFEEFLNGE